jgi:hypothetical protein
VQSQFPPASAPSHFVIRVSGKPAGLMETFAEAAELASIMNDIPGCPVVTIEELAGPMPDDHDVALRRLRARGKVANDVAIAPVRPKLRLIKGGR